MVVEACRGYLFEGEVLGEGRTITCQHLLLPSSIGLLVLEILVLVNHLYSMLILLFSRLLAHIRKMAVDRHDGRGGRVSDVV